MFTDGSTQGYGLSTQAYGFTNGIMYVSDPTRSQPGEALPNTLYCSLGPYGVTHRYDPPRYYCYLPSSQSSTYRRVPELSVRYRQAAAVSTGARPGGDSLLENRGEHPERLPSTSCPEQGNEAVATTALVSTNKTSDEQQQSQPKAESRKARHKQNNARRANEQAASDNEYFSKNKQIYEPGRYRVKVRLPPVESLLSKPTDVHGMSCVRIIGKEQAPDSDKADIAMQVNIASLNDFPSLARATGRLPGRHGKHRAERSHESPAPT